MSTPILKLAIVGTDDILAHACGKCRRVAHNEAAAAQCCEPYICECGATCRQHWTACEECLAKKRVLKEQERFEKAEKIPWRDYEGPVFAGSDYHESVEMYFDSLACDNEPGDIPNFVWACTEHKMGRICASDLIESVLDDHHEDAYEWIEDEDELQASLDAWVAKQTLVTWMEDNTRAVSLEGAKEEIWPAAPAEPSDGTPKRKGS